MTKQEFKELIKRVQEDGFCFNFKTSNKLVALELCRGELYHSDDAVFYLWLDDSKKWVYYFSPSETEGEIDEGIDSLTNHLKEYGINFSSLDLEEDYSFEEEEQ